MNSEQELKTYGSISQNDDKEIRKREDSGKEDKEHEELNDVSDKFKHGHCTCNYYFPRRYLTSFLTGLGLVLIYSMRTNVGMTAITFLDASSVLKVGTHEAQENLPMVMWNERMVGFLHSIFYVGYLLSHLPGGYLSTVWRCSRMYGGCILFSGTLNMCLPFCIEHLHFAAPCVVRFIQGFSEGLLYPACYGVLRHWSTPDERGRLVSIVLTGCYAGAIMGFPLAGFITHYVGWQYVYYVSGLLCVAWFLLWLCLVTEKPSHSSSISDEELEYLATGQGQASIDYENLKIPWKRIFSSLPVLALCLCHFARNWVFILMLTNEPYYLNNFGFSIAENGIFSSLPHIVKVCLSIISGFMADCLLKKESCTTTCVRKFLTAIGFFGQAVFFFMLTLTENWICVVTFLTLGVGLFGLSVSGWQINHYDLAVRYAGVLVSISSACGTVAAIAVPLVAGELVFRNKEIKSNPTASNPQDSVEVYQDMTGWHYIFYITVAILLFASICFMVLGSGKDQPWAHPPPDIQLIQKVDPLELKPYKVKTQQRPHKPTSPLDIADSSSTESIQSRLVQRLSRKLSGNDEIISG